MILKAISLSLSISTYYGINRHCKLIFLNIFSLGKVNDRTNGGKQLTPVSPLLKERRYPKVEVS
jgi:hypothetical protein